MWIGDDRSIDLGAIGWSPRLISAIGSGRTPIHDGGMIRVTEAARLDVDADRDELGFEIFDAVPHLLGLVFQSLDVASRGGATGDAIGGATFRIVLTTGRATSGQAIAPDLPNLLIGK